MHLFCPLVYVALAFSPLTSFAAEVTVFAAASLSDALTEIGKTYPSAHGDKLRFNFAASSALARQIKEGAPADIFFSADEAKLNDLEKAGLVAPDTRRTLLANTLVIVVRTDSPVEIKSTAGLTKPEVTRIALGEPSTVPIGIYAKTYLQKIELWEKLFAKVVSTENVRAALAAVESGNAEAAFVYKTDALISKKVKIAVEIPASESPAISYPLAIIKDSKQPEAALKLTTYLASPEAQAIFARYGFLPAP